MRTRTISAIMLCIILAATLVSATAAAPPVPTLPFEVYGTVTLNGQPAPVGLWVEAWIDGEKKATGTIVEYGGESVFSLVVPSSGVANPGTDTPIEQGQTITFTIAGVPASVNQSVSWDLGAVEQRSLSATATMHVAQLQQGWNLVSLTVAPNSTARADVLASLAGKYDIAYIYLSEDTADPWKKYDVNAPFEFFNDLTNIDQTQGFWIRMTEGATFALPGNPLNADPIVLRPGWNLVSYKGSPQSVPNAMTDCAGMYDIVYGYNASDTADPWKKYDVNAPFEFFNDLTQMQPGWGYWIRITAQSNCNWTP